MTSHRAALGGIVGPGAFIGCWLAGGALTGAAYSPVDDAISRLAQIGADTRPLMTTGFIVFGVGLPSFALALRERVAGPAWLTAAVTGISTLAVAATPLERSETIDGLHGLFATIGYIALAATPLLAARPLSSCGHRRLALAGVVASAVSAVSLALTTVGPLTGLFQRVGLTASDVWIVATAIAMLTGRIDHVPALISRGRASNQ